MQKYNSDSIAVSSGAIFDQARDRDLNRFLDDDSVGCIWCGDGIAEHSDPLRLRRLASHRSGDEASNLDWIEYSEFENEYYHPNCFNRFIDREEEKIIAFLQKETEAGQKC